VRHSGGATEHASTFVENAYPVTEFEAEVTTHGTITVPRTVARMLSPGETVTIRLTRGVVGNLRGRGVTEDEVEQIASRQLEPRENVLRFLAAEGALASALAKGAKRRTRGAQR
jgi:hypothetical protein